MPIQWFPGHMARARRVLAENLSLVDIVVEIVDARIPFSSRNPEIDNIIGAKPRIIISNKMDLADPDMNNFWKEYYKKLGINVIFTDCQSGVGVKSVTNAINEAMSEKFERQVERGRRMPTVKAMIVGIPNVGKSSFINRVAGKAAAITGDKPGVTRNKQWLRMNENIFLLDTPGLLWPKIEDQRCAYRLACTGAIKDDILDQSDIAIFLLEFLKKYYRKPLNERYKIEVTDEMTGLEILTACGTRRGCLIKGGEVDYTRASNIILDDYRAGKIGRITLDREDALKEI